MSASATKKSRVSAAGLSTPQKYMPSSATKSIRRLNGGNTGRSNPTSGVSSSIEMHRTGGAKITAYNRT